MTDPAQEPLDLVMITFDSLRFDVASRALREGRTPFLEKLTGGNWECRHTPGSFTYAAHAAFFAGFWPTPITPGPQARPFALRFPGQRTVDASTCMLPGDNIVAGLRERGYRTVCIGGVGFFNKLNPLGRVFPAMFEESEWSPAFSVSALHSTRDQVRCAVGKIDATPETQPLFLFLNLSATHPPTHVYLPGARADSIDTQLAALVYVDRQLPPLFERLAKRRRGGRAYLMSDHGTLFGEEGFTGHRVAHPDVWNVPYAEYAWEAAT
jgi:Sulfatase